MRVGATPGTVEPDLHRLAWCDRAVPGGAGGGHRGTLLGPLGAPALLHRLVAGEGELQFPVLDGIGAGVGDAHRRGEPAVPVVGAVVHGAVLLPAGARA